MYTDDRLGTTGVVGGRGLQTAEATCGPLPPRSAPADVRPQRPATLRRLRIEFTLGGRRGVWEREWDLGYLIDNGPVSSAADWFARIAWTAFLEMQDTQSQPRGLRMLDE